MWRGGGSVIIFRRSEGGSELNLPSLAVGTTQYRLCDARFSAPSLLIIISQFLSLTFFFYFHFENFSSLQNIFKVSFKWKTRTVIKVLSHWKPGHWCRQQKRIGMIKNLIGRMRKNWRAAHVDRNSAQFYCPRQIQQIIQHSCHGDSTRLVVVHLTNISKYEQDKKKAKLSGLQIFTWVFLGIIAQAP